MSLKIKSIKLNSINLRTFVYFIPKSKIKNTMQIVNIYIFDHFKNEHFIQRQGQNFVDLLDFSKVYLH